MPALSAPSKPLRLGLWAPYLLVAVAFLAWSLYWLALKSQVQAGLDREASRLRQEGYQVEWARRTVGGYPFRLEVELHGVRLAEPSGWAVAAPSLKGVAAAYQIDHWVFVVPSGLVLSRPGAAEVDVRAGVLRASLAEARTAPRLSLQGRDLTFASRPGPRPFPFTAAKGLELHLRPADGDRTQMFWEMQEARTGRAGLFARIAPLAPLNFRIAAELSHRSAFAGEDWADAVRGWTAQGGGATVREMTASVGDVALSAEGGPLTVGEDGRLRGRLQLNLREGAAALSSLGAPSVAPNGGVSLPLVFEGGAARLGPVQISPALKVY